MFDIHVDKIHAKLAQYREAGKSFFVSSSFQTHSIPLLHILMRFDRKIPVYFLNTGFHFPETLHFKETISDLLDMPVIDLTSDIPKISQRDMSGKFYYASDPDRCCYINKVLPLEPILKTHDVWISGVRRDQTRFRKDLGEEESGAFQTLRYHPMLDWTSKMIWEYRKQYNLPEHPLDSQGYLSIGCVPCTRKWDGALDDRNTRWQGMTKEECGIHTEFTNK